MSLSAGTKDDYGNPLFHDQVMTSQGIYVDAELKDLLEALWSHDFVTTHSCQGGTEIAREAYIVFRTMGHALKFVGDSMARGVSEYYQTFDRIQTGEWIVRWVPSVTVEITKAWTR